MCRTIAKILIVIVFGSLLAPKPLIDDSTELVFDLAKEDSFAGPLDMPLGHQSHHCDHGASSTHHCHMGHCSFYLPEGRDRHHVPKIPQFHSFPLVETPATKIYAWPLLDPPRYMI